MGKARIIHILRAPLERFIAIESSSSIALVVCTIVAFSVANSSLAYSYDSLFHEPSIFSLSLSHIINDGLMAVFFFVVGLEIKREVLTGELSDRKRASLPIFGAIGGMLIPALIFVVLNNNTTTEAGWAIPMATDIAFAVGVVSLLGKRVHPSLKVFLLALAIVDDIGAILVIAFFFTATITWIMLGAAFVLLGVLLLGNRKGINSLLFYWSIGIGVWYLFLCSGVHATIAGVLVAFTVPASGTNADRGEPPLTRFENSLHTVVAFVIMPIFALANAGVSISPEESLASLSGSLSLGILFGLCIGKPLGITVFAWIGCKIGVASLPRDIKWVELLSISVLGGIGFTMSLFIANLAFDDRVLVDAAKLAILLASLISGIVGYFLLSTSQRKAKSH